MAMEKVNPAFIPRNHLVEAALSAAVERQDFRPFEELLDVVSRPYRNGRDWSSMLGPQKPKKAFGGRSVIPKPPEQLSAPAALYRTSGLPGPPPSSPGARVTRLPPHFNGVDLLCARSFRYHLFPSFYSRPSPGRRPPKRRSARGDRVSPPAAMAWLFPVSLPPLRPASRFWNRAETPPMQAPPLCWHCP